MRNGDKPTILERMHVLKTDVGNLNRTRKTQNNLNLVWSIVKHGLFQNVANPVVLMF